MKNLKIILTAMAVCVVPSAALAQGADEGVVSFGRRTPTVDEVAKALGSAPEGAPEAAGSLQSRGVSLGGTTATTRAGARIRAMDMDVEFGFGSESLTSKAKAQLRPLGEYLKSTKLDANVVVIEGHTDSLGSADFTNDLSARRAQVVRDFLVDEYKLNSNNFVVLGRGKQLPKDRGNPASETNRRVQFYIRPKE